jgi:hypothetical protein
LQRRFSQLPAARTRMAMLNVANVSKDMIRARPPPD